jgi:hypothetical protein
MKWLIILELTANMLAHLLFASLYGALPENSTIDAQLHQILILAFAFVWQNLTFFLKNWPLLFLADLINS